MVTVLDYLADRADQRVQQALTRTCGICKAKPGADCRVPWEPKDQLDTLDRIVHLERAQQELDKRKRRKPA